jgi:hypothetical protein
VEKTGAKAGRNSDRQDGFSHIHFPFSRREKLFGAYNSEVPAHESPKTRMNLSNLELAFILHAVWEPAKHGDVVARTLFLKTKRAIIQAGIPWEYGDPWLGGDGPTPPPATR